MKTTQLPRNVFLIAFAIMLFSHTASAQNSAYEPPRLPNGKPDLQGVWTNTSLTRLERMEPFVNLVIPEASAGIAANMHTAFLRDGSKPTEPDAPAPSVGEDVGGYNTFWLDYGEQYGFVRGEYRSSWIVEPADGRLPYSEAGLKARDRARQIFGAPYTDPEARPLGERCLVGFGSSGGPPMLNVDYNNNYQFVQTDDHVMIMAEMNHDARIIRIGNKRTAGQSPKWLGDSIGWWDGDTLVVETTNMHPSQSLRQTFTMSLYISPDAMITERFTRVANDQILYEFEVEDPDIYTQTWRGEMPLRASNERIFEYACHEGNVALPGILAGARLQQQNGNSKQTTP